MFIPMRFQDELTSRRIFWPLTRREEGAYPGGSVTDEPRRQQPKMNLGTWQEAFMNLVRVCPFRGGDQSKQPLQVLRFRPD